MSATDSDNNRTPDNEKFNHYFRILTDMLRSNSSNDVGGMLDNLIEDVNHDPTFHRLQNIRNENAAAQIERDNSGTLSALEQDVERLTMITQALWEFIKEHHGYQDSDLFQKVIAIDALDGRIDGRVAKVAPRECPKCGRVLRKRRPSCSYCGEIVIQNIFDR